MKTQYTVTVWNTATSRYEEITVAKEIYDEYRRGEWRISKNNDKHSAKETPFSAVNGGENGNCENFHEFISDSGNPEHLVTAKELYEAIASLSEDEQILIQAIFFEGLTMRQYAERFHVPLMTAQDRKIRILKKLKNFLE